ncbi:flagellar basal body P-ring biosynthesis protein FlgA [Legionella birminghamensis]|uniref:Flagella basal body P-ring formation protein FlgA n=1 Tax=Legionella birminghamensis TaxID=28083 RepID=A0A378IAU7_9GAMM|nr:flagellar basal body P-ring formation chaperone FlgA [Legionella birminghamensis]KTC75599.1 flagellar basal body P-ring biosynthesis protein FlgA [Legionella birminghamensis]STX31922.1 flagella basal body P-ring formation protein FlgA [Legionella birminghamensis]
MIYRLLLVFICLFFPLTNYAEEQSLDLLSQKVESFVKKELQNRQYHNISISAENIDQRLHLQKCPSKYLETFNPYPNMATQHTTVGIRCKAPENHWTLYVPVKITILKEVLVSTHALSKGDVLTNKDLRLQKQNINYLSTDYLDNMDQAVGLVIKKNLREGQLINHSQLQKPCLVHKGEQIVIQAVNGNIKIAMAAVALADGALNETIKVRNLTSKRIVDAQVVDVRKVEVMTS